MKTFQKSSPQPNKTATLTNRRTSVDPFINNLVEGKETLIPHVTQFFIPQEAITQKLEFRNLPPVDLLRFDGVHWPEFIDNFYHRIHKNLSFHDSLRMGHLMNSLDGGAKKLVKTVGTNSYGIESFKKKFWQSLNCVEFKIEKAT